MLDTYDTINAAHIAVDVAKEMDADGHRLTGVRLDSGDFDDLSRQVRRILDAAGLDYVRIVASGGLDEYELERLIQGGAPIDMFGVGTRVGVSADAPYCDMVYKMVCYDGRPVMKLSTGKSSLPGGKQVFRQRSADGKMAGDVIALDHEEIDSAEPLLTLAMSDGRRLMPASPIDAARQRVADGLASLPEQYRKLAERRTDTRFRPAPASNGWKRKFAAILNRRHSCVLPRHSCESRNPGSHESVSVTRARHPHLRSITSMKIAVCVKYVPVVSRIQFDYENKVIQREGVPSEINPFDLLGINMAVDLKHGDADSVIALSMGPPNAAEGLTQCYALGADRAILLSDRALAGSDTLATAQALSLALQREEPDLIVCGRNSSDAETGQVGPEVAELMGLPHISNVRKLEIDRAGNRINGGTRHRRGLPGAGVRTSRRGVRYRGSRPGTLPRSRGDGRGGGKIRRATHLRRPHR